MKSERRLTASLEDYLEAIHEIAVEKGAARPTDVAARLSVANSSVTHALHNLVDRDLVKHASYDLISLTPKGHRVADKIVRRHNILTQFFVQILDLDRTVAEDCACKMEHFIPDSVMDRFLAFVRCHQQDDGDGMTWVDGKGFLRAAGGRKKRTARTKPQGRAPQHDR